MSAINGLTEQMLIPYRVGKYWGYSDENGEIVIPAIYHQVSWFYDETAWVYMWPRLIKIDKIGQVIDQVDFPIGISAETNNPNRVVASLIGS